MPRIIRVEPSNQAAALTNCQMSISTVTTFRVPKCPSATPAREEAYDAFQKLQENNGLSPCRDPHRDEVVQRTDCQDEFMLQVVRLSHEFILNFLQYKMDVLVCR